MKKITPDEARAKLIARREAHEEFERLSERYWTLRETMKPEAIMATWLLLGDAMWEGFSDA
jgi:hypothetical protein